MWQPEPEGIAAALPALRPFLSDATVFKRVLHRLLYCEPLAPFHERCSAASGLSTSRHRAPLLHRRLWRPPRGRVEGALSGIALSAASAATAQPSQS